MWNYIEDNEYPLTYERGDCDGKRSNLMIIELENNQFRLGRLYEIIMDGSKYLNWIEEKTEYIIDEK